MDADPKRSLRHAGYRQSLRLVLTGAICAAASPALAQDFIVYKVGGDECPYHDVQSALNDAAAHPGPDYVWISNTGTYDDQHVVVTNDDVIIEGGFTDCLQDAPTVQTTLRGTDGHSVLEIEGTSNVYLANVFLTGATMDETHRGGGIFFGGDGSLEIANSTIGANTSGYGGGIDMSPSGSASLTLDDNTIVINNTALISGGGIRLEGNARLYALKPQTLITANQALSGDGGGLEIVGPARADIGSPGYNGEGVLFGNTAQYGGGADVIGTESGEAILRVFTTDPAQAVQISNNVAYATGGAVYLKAWATVGNEGSITALFCATDFRIEGNTAQEGAAIYVDSDYDVTGIPLGSHVQINSTDDMCMEPEAPPALGAVPCASGVACNRIGGNITQLSDGTPTAGSTLLIQNSGYLTANRIEARGNVGNHFLRGVGGNDFNGDNPIIAVGDCLVAGNTVTGELFAAEGDDQMNFYVDECTVAGNTIGASSVIRSAGDGTQLYRTIIDQPGLSTIEPSLTNPSNAKYLLVTDASTLPDAGWIEQGSPTFVDAADGDYHLTIESSGVDYAPGDTHSTAVDLDGALRVVDLPGIAGPFGPLDLGAYEIQLTTVLSCAVGDTIFCNGFDQ